MLPNSPEAYALRAREELISEIHRTDAIAEARGANLGKTILSLSGGALVFSMTFVEKLAPLKQNIPILFAAWIVFGISIISTVIWMKKAHDAATTNMLRFVQLMREFEKFSAECIANNQNVNVNRFPLRNRPIVIWNWTAIIACLTGLTLLGFFVARNLLATA